MAHKVILLQRLQENHGNWKPRKARSNEIYIFSQDIHTWQSSKQKLLYDIIVVPVLSHPSPPSEPVLPQHIAPCNVSHQRTSSKHLLNYSKYTTPDLGKISPRILSVANPAMCAKSSSGILYLKICTLLATASPFLLRWSSALSVTNLLIPPSVTNLLISPSTLSPFVVPNSVAPSYRVDQWFPCFTQDIIQSTKCCCGSQHTACSIKCCSTW